MPRTKMTSTFNSRKNQLANSKESAARLIVRYEQRDVTSGINALSSLDNDILLYAVTQITPISMTRKDDIDAIRNLRNQGFYPAINFEQETSANAQGRKVPV